MASDALIKDRVHNLLHQQNCVFDDFTLTEFNDEILADSILSVSLSDFDNLVLERKVTDKHSVI